MSRRLTSAVIVVATVGLGLAACGPRGEGGADGWSLHSDAGPRVPDTGVDGERIISELDDSEVRGVCESLARTLTPWDNLKPACIGRAHRLVSKEWDQSGDGGAQISEAQVQCQNELKACKESVEDLFDQQPQPVSPSFFCRGSASFSDSCDATVAQWSRCVLQLDGVYERFAERLPRCGEVTSDFYSKAGDRLSCEMTPTCRRFYDQCPDFAFGQAFQFIGVTSPPAPFCLELPNRE